MQLRFTHLQHETKIAKKTLDEQGMISILHTQPSQTRSRPEEYHKHTERNASNSLAAWTTRECVCFPSRLSFLPQMSTSAPYSKRRNSIICCEFYPRVRSKNLITLGGKQDLFC